MRLPSAGVLLAAMTPLTSLSSPPPSAVVSGRTAGQVPPGPGFERVPRYGETASSDRPVSPAVVASWIARVGPERTGTLEILVSWRGSPGWFTRSQGSGGMTSGGGGGTAETRTIVQLVLRRHRPGA